MLKLKGRQNDIGLDSSMANMRVLKEKVVISKLISHFPYSIIIKILKVVFILFLHYSVLIFAVLIFLGKP